MTEERIQGTVDKKVENIVAKVLEIPVSEVNDDLEFGFGMKPFSIELDMIIIGVVIACEEELDIEISDEETQAITNVGQLKAKVLEKVQAKPEEQTS